MFQGLVIPAVAHPRTAVFGEDDTTDYNVLRDTVGGWLEAVNLYHPETRSKVTVWLDEEGKLKRLPLNVKATALAADALGNDVIVGTVVITGVIPASGENGERVGPLPQEWVDLLATLGLPLK